ncbi:MAG: hypothetical protein AABP62_25495 [Planctomycetota bacterium]
MSVTAEDEADARVAEAALAGEVSELEEKQQSFAALRTGPRAGIVLHPLGATAILPTI